jgi:hypothetical protein
VEYSSLAKWIEHQEPWSELPIIFLAHSGQPTKVTAQRSRVLSLRGAVTVLERGPCARAHWLGRYVYG